MSKNRKVYVGEEYGVKTFFAISYSNNGLKIDIYKFKASDLTREFIDDLYKVWRDLDEKISFPIHDHIAWDLTVSSTIPEFTGIGRPEDRNRLDDDAKKALQKHYSNLHSDILNSEIKKLKGNVWSLSTSSKRDEIDICLKIAISINQKIKEAKEKGKNPNKGNNWRELLTPKDAYTLSQQMQEIFERINNIKAEIENKNFSKLENQLDSLENEVRKTTDFKKTREELKNFQQNLKNYCLEKNKREIIFKQVQSLFDTLFKRQKEQNEKYESECKRNFETIQRTLNELDYHVSNSTNWKEVKEKIKDIQTKIKELKFNKEQREIIYKRINSYFEKINTRQTKANEEYRKECEKNENYISRKADECSSLSYNSTNWKNAREYIFSVMKEMKDLKLSKDSRQKIYNRIQESLERLNKRQNEEKRKYDEKCNSNYSSFISKVRDFKNSISYSDGSNAKELRENLKDLQGDIKNYSLNRDQRQDLFNQVNDCFSRLQIKQQNFFDKIRIERTEKSREIIYNLKDKIASLNSQISDLNYKIREKENKLHNVRPGPRANEIKLNIKDSINQFNSKIKSKEEAIYNIQNKIRDIESKMWKTKKSSIKWGLYKAV